MHVPLFLKKIIPESCQLPARYYRLQFQQRLDVELSVLRNRRPRCRRILDVGANIGIWTYGFSRYADKVEAFEPIADCTRMLAAYARSAGKITIHNVALSDLEGCANLYVPQMAGAGRNVGLASFTDPGGDREVVSVPIRTLDSYAFKEVDILKIDVEGHELAVLRGGAETIARERPLLLIEIEQRHLKDSDINRVFRQVLAMGYKGGFFENGVYQPLEEFSYEKNQRPFLDSIYTHGYINNFLFEPVESLARK